MQSKLLVVSEKGIGDALTLIPGIHALKKVRPDIDICLLSPGIHALRENYRTLAEIINPPEISEFCAHELIGWLTKNNFAHVWNTTNRNNVWRDAIQLAGNPRWKSAAPHKTLARSPMIKQRVHQLRTLFPEVAACEEFGCILTLEQEKICRGFKDQRSAFTSIIALQPGSNKRIKNWPAEKYRALALKLAEDEKMLVVFFLTSRDAEIFTPEFAGGGANIERIIDPLETAVAKLAACDIFVGNDSGFYHLAHAVGLPVVGLFRTLRSAWMWAYRGKRNRAIYHYLPSRLRKYWSRLIAVNRVYRAVCRILHR
ncbi:MAG: hypothetical protein GF398_15945 [Chitinivibrionales bacterium]|nr:hypothetical protein [Chitinivibrionales bacterium]